MRSVLTASLSLALLAGCANLAGKPDCRCTDTSKPAPITAVYQAASWAELPGWPGDQLQASWAAWLQSCSKLAAKPAWKALCTDARAVPANDAAAIQAFFEARFVPQRISTSEGKDSGLVTGYYEPLLKGSREAAPNRAPIYGVPDDLLTIDLGELYPELKGQRVRGRLDGRKVVPYFKRAEIEAGQAPMAGLALAWADDPIEAFFLQVQGSGRIELEDGSLLRVGYADQNGQPYKSIGKWLIEQGLLPASEASMQGIQAWARANPARLNELLNSNPSYVFFRVLPDANGGPIGALNVPLTDGASVAIDPKFVPLGSPLYLSTTRPADPTPLNRLVQAQDTGGAIRGPIRVDFFWGFGHEAGQLAGRMKQSGQVWLLWPRDMPLPGGK